MSFLHLFLGEGFACRCLTLVRRPTFYFLLQGGGLSARAPGGGGVDDDDNATSRGATRKGAGTHRSPSLANQTKLPCVSQLARTGPVRDDEERALFSFFGIFWALVEIFFGTCCPPFC